MDEFVKRVAKCDECIHNSVCFMQEVCNDIEEQLREFGCDHYRRTADVVEVQHREWKPTDPESDVRFFCSGCETEISTSWDYDNSEMWNYCPYCGAKMDGKRKDGAE